MNGRFFDTNVLIYAASADAEKATKAEALLAGGGVISVQVLNEFVNVARHKLHRSWPEIRGYLTAARHFLKVEPLTVALHDKALAVAERHKLHIYDASIVAAALLSGCDTLYSEDMHDGLVIEGKLRVTNPFSTLS